MPDSSTDTHPILAEVVLPSGDLSETIRFFIDRLGFRMDSIAPADDPEVAQLSGHGLRIRLDRDYQGQPGTLRLATRDVELEQLTAPNGTQILFEPVNPPLQMPALQAQLCIQRHNQHNAWVTGRAGMHYRDLIPDRQGGRFIASHIRIPEGGPVPDNVHYHHIRFQMIYCYRGWVKLVYEDQGEPFVMNAGDCVLQPPLIRHRVLESSDGLEVIEIGSPARHMTFLDHDMPLPTGRLQPGRDFDGQLYHFHQNSNADWINDASGCFSSCDLGISSATDRLARVRVLRYSKAADAQLTSTTHDKEFAFWFVLQGQLRLSVNQHTEQLSATDSFVVPAGMAYSFKHCSDDLELLEVCLPG